MQDSMRDNFIWLCDHVRLGMSEEKKDRFKRIDSAIDKIREEIDDVAEGGRSAGGKASREVREAIDNLEAKIERLRKRDQ